MEDNMNTVLDDGRGSQPMPQRPLFLTILCVLSFIGNGLMIMGVILGMIWMRVMRPVMEMAMEQEPALQEDPFLQSGFGQKIFELFDYFPTIYGIMLGAAVLNIFGVVLMWKLKKSGFYLYSITEMIPPIANIVILAMVFGGFGVAMSLLNFIIPLGFVIMYGLNLKHMR
ncbi:MAG: hypothetical protein R6V49_08740 [Bacteroidales bacterium]